MWIDGCTADGKNIRIREIEESEIAKVFALETDVFSDAWTMNGIKETFSQKTARIAGAFEGENLCGYLIIYFILDEAEIARIAVDEHFRRMGIAGGLMEWLHEFAKEQNVTRILLDVRESNAGARAFYEKWGFTIDGIRKNFYSDPVESAVLMSKER